jgi:hypothetical protein
VPKRAEAAALAMTIKAKNNDEDDDDEVATLRSMIKDEDKNEAKEAE